MSLAAGTLFESAQTDIQEALQLNPMDANAHLEASKLEVARARASFQSDKDNVLAHLQNAREHADSSVALRVNDCENLLQRAATDRYFIELQELTHEQSDALLESATRYLKQARALTEFQACCDLEEAYLWTAAGQRARALGLAQSAIQAGGHLATEAGRLEERLSESLK